MPCSFLITKRYFSPSLLFPVYNAKNKKGANKLNNQKAYNKKYNDIQEELFLSGIKPTAFYQCNKERAVKLRKKGYPYIVIVSEEVKGCLFFPNKRAMSEFMEKKGLNLPIMELNHEYIGEALGYPPLAYKNFHMADEERYLIHYHGFDFSCRKQDVEACLHFMKESYRIPKELEIEISVVEPKKEKIMN